MAFEVPTSWIGLSTDTKPAASVAGLILGSLFIEHDTGKGYIWNGTSWVWVAAKELLDGGATTGHTHAGAPAAHKTSHQDAGSDEISVLGLSGLLADGQTPLTHATSHKSAGADSVKLDELAAPTDITALNASTTLHGLVVKAVAPAASVLNVVGIANGETAYTNKAMLDGTNPAALGTAAPGTSLIASHRDHVHLDPVTAHAAISATSTHGSIGHAAITLDADADTLLGLTGQALSLDTQLANLVLAGPASGGAVDPTFRALVDADIPAAITRDAEHGGFVPTGHHTSFVQADHDALPNIHHATAHGTAQHTEGTAWRVTYQNASGDDVELILGAAETYLRSNGAAAAPDFAAPTAALPSLIKGLRAPAASQTIATGETGMIGINYEITGVLSLTIAGTGALVVM